MKREKSCGAVVFADDGGKRLYLLEKMRQGHYAMCKGHVEGGEEETETAAREILEETGLRVVFIPGFRETTSYSPYPGCMKEVVYFAAQSDTLETVAQEEEVSEILWLPLEEAMERLTFADDRELLRRADQWLETR